MARIIGLIVLLIAALTLGGCGALPSGFGYGYGDASGGYGGGGSYPQAYGGGMPMAAPVDPGYGGGYAASGAYAPQAQPYYGPQAYAQPYGQPYAYDNNGPAGYGPQGGPQYSDSTASRRIDRREWEEAARIRQGVRDGSITPQEAQRLWAEQRRIRGAEARMKADGNLDPRERARLNGMLNHGNQDIYRARHNDVVRPDGSAGPVAQPNHWGRHNNNNMAQPNNGPMVRPNRPMRQPENGAVPMAQPGFSRGPQMQAPMQQQARPMQQQIRPMQPPMQQQVRPVQPTNGPRVQPGTTARYRRITTTQ